MFSGGMCLIGIGVWRLDGAPRPAQTPIGTGVGSARLRSVLGGGFNSCKVGKQIRLELGSTGPRFGDGSPRAEMAEAIWFDWLRIAVENAREARREEDERGRQGDWKARSMVAITAAAFALGGFAASLRRNSEIAKFEQGDEPSAAWLITETVKRAAALGGKTNEVQAEVKWLFKLRDPLVHPGEEFRGAVRTYAFPDEQVSVETRDYCGGNAEKAARIALELVRLCFANPRPAAEAWFDLRKGLLDEKTWLSEPEGP